MLNVRNGMRKNDRNCVRERLSKERKVAAEENREDSSNSNSNSNSVTRFFKSEKLNKGDATTLDNWSSVLTFFPFLFNITKFV
jgi:hypothetical protein